MPGSAFQEAETAVMGCTHIDTPLSRDPILFQQSKLVLFVALFADPAVGSSDFRPSQQTSSASSLTQPCIWRSTLLPASSSAIWRGAHSSSVVVAENFKVLLVFIETPLHFGEIGRRLHVNVVPSIAPQTSPFRSPVARPFRITISPFDRKGPQSQRRVLTFGCVVFRPCR